MGLTMSEKRSITRETAQRYRKDDKKGKHTIFNELVQTTGYNVTRPEKFQKLV